MPLVEASNNLCSLDDEIDSTMSLLQRAQSAPEAKEDTVYEQATQLLNTLMAEPYQENIMHTLLAIKKDDGYFKQLKVRELKRAASAAEDNADANTVNAVANSMNAFKR